MAARPDRTPGQFKMQNNHAGDTHFVDYTLVRGTLLKGFEYYQALESPFAKALFMLFMVSEVHPFTDGNGRISRIMMNAELQEKIVELQEKLREAQECVEVYVISPDEQMKLLGLDMGAPLRHPSSGIIREPLKI